MTNSTEVRGVLAVMDECADAAEKFSTRVEIRKARAAVAEVIEALQYCEMWFAGHSPTSELITGDAAEHPMLTCIRTALIRVGGAK